LVGDVELEVPERRPVYVFNLFRGVCAKVTSPELLENLDRKEVQDEINRVIAQAKK